MVSVPAPASLHVECAGDPNGAPVILLHSSGLSGRQWQRLVPLVGARGFRTIVPDLAGHGASPPLAEPAPLSYQDDVAAVLALLEDEGPAHVIGHSYGALIGVLAAVRAPARVRSLALFEPVAFAVLDEHTDADARAELGAIDFRWGPTQEERDRWLAAFVDYWGGAGAWSALREEARAEFRRVGWAVREGVRTLMEDTTPRTAYAAIHAPVTLLSGERSPLAARRVAARLTEALPNARLITVENAGHMAPLTHAAKVNELLLASLPA